MSGGLCGTGRKICEDLMLFRPHRGISKVKDWGFGQRNHAKKNQKRENPAGLRTSRLEWPNGYKTPLV